MTSLLAIETATESCSAALLFRGEVYQRYEHQPQKQASLILPMIDGLLNEAGLVAAELDALAFANGPGSFTGLRVATAVAQGIAVAADLPVVPVSTLAVIAQGVYRRYGDSFVLPALDARMSEVYWGAYQLDSCGLMRAVCLDCVLPPDKVSLPFQAEWAGAGSGWDVYSQTLQSTLNNDVKSSHSGFWPEAQDILSLAAPELSAGRAVLAEQAQPIYLRNNVAKSKSERQSDSSA